MHEWSPELGLDCLESLPPPLKKKKYSSCEAVSQHYAGSFLRVYEV